MRKITKSDLLQANSNATLPPLNRFESRSSFIRNLHLFMKSFPVQIFLFTIILLSIGLLCVETYADARQTYQVSITVLDTFCLAVFLVECVCKLLIWRQFYFCDGWNLIDFLMLIVSLIDFTANAVTIAYAPSGTHSSVGLASNSSTMSLDFLERINVLSMVKHLKVLRTMRAFKSLRVVRTIKLLSSLEIIIDTCINSIQSLRAIFILMSIFLYDFAVVATSLFRGIDSKRFGNLVNSSFTLFQVITLDDWYSIYRTNLSNPTNEAEKAYFGVALDYFLKHYFLICFLISFLIVENFIMLNLFVAVLVDNFHQARESKNIVKKNKELVNVNSEICLRRDCFKCTRFTHVFSGFFAKFQNKDSVCGVVSTKPLGFLLKKPLFKLRTLALKNSTRTKFKKRIHTIFRRNVSEKIYFRKNAKSIANLNNNNSNDSTSSCSFEKINDLIKKKNEFNSSESDESESETLDNWKRLANAAESASGKQTSLTNRHFQLMASIEYHSSQMRELYSNLESLINITQSPNETDFVS